MNRDKREPEYPAELESQFILRLPEEPAKTLRDVLQTGENLKNRLTIQVDSDVRHGEVRLDHWLMHAKIVDLPTIIESLKTIDNKSFYKTADVCQMMICKDEPDQTTTDEESTSKNKKKDPYKVDKKFLFPHGVTPPTKNVRRRRFRKTLKKKYAEGPEIEKEVKRLLRADNEAISVTWEIVTEDNELEQKVIPSTSKSSKTSTTVKAEKKTKSDRNTKSDAQPKTSTKVSHSETSKVVDIFGGAVSDSEDEDHKPNIPVELEDSHLSAYDSMFDTNSIYGLGDARSKHGERVPIEFDSQMFQPAHTSQASTSQGYSDSLATLELSKSRGLSDDDGDSQQKDVSKDDMTLRIEELKTELEELKQQRQRTQLEMVGMENLALRKRFQDILHTLNQDIMYKDMEYQGLIVMQTSEDI